MGISKLFAARVTGSRSDTFRSAHRTLTLLYLAILTAIVVVLSSALYELHAHDVAGLDRRRVVPDLRAELEGPPGLTEYLERLGRSIIAADIITIAIGGALSYILAGRTLRPIRESVEAEQRFFANAAHDLRTPLAVMRAEAEVALRAPRLDDAEARKVIASSLEEIGRMSAMVEQMLDLARGESPRSNSAAAFQQVDLAELARNLTAKMARRAADRAVRLVSDAPGPADIRGDALALQRAVSNVLENALSYTPAGGAITVGVQRHGSHVVLSVTDTGIGIPAEDLPHITEPFYRGDRARAAHSGGAGLGLTIARATTEAHRGSLHAASSPGAGTTISMRFPGA